MTVRTLVGRARPHPDALGLEPFQNIGGDQVTKLLRIVVSPAHQLSLAAKPIERIVIPLAHHVMPEHGGDAARVELVENRLDVVQIQRALAMFLDERLGIRVRPEGPGLITPQMEVPHIRTQGEHIIDHPLNQFARAGRERIEAHRLVRHFAHRLIAAHVQRRFHVAEALDQRNDLDAEPGSFGCECRDLLRRVGRFRLESPVHRPRESIFPLDEHRIDAQLRQHTEQTEQTLRRRRTALQIKVNAANRNGRLVLTEQIID